MSELVETLPLSEAVEDEKEASEVLQPEKIDKKSLVEGHGLVGRFFLTLRRYALLGWMAFFILLLFNAGGLFLDRIIPKPVMVVDQDGVFLGDVDFFKPIQRQDDELLSAGKKFLSFYLSMNSESIFEDYAVAMNMMETPLFEKTKNTLKHDGYLSKVSKAKSRSHIEFDLKDGRTALIERKGQTSSSRYQGILTIFGPAGTPLESPFDITLFMKSVPSSSLRRAGIEITEIRDN